MPLEFVGGEPPGDRGLCRFQGATLSPVDLPARSIIGLEYCGGSCGTEGCGAVLITCDCAESCHLTVEVPETGVHEIAYTCDGCHSVTWFTVTREPA